MATAEMLVLGLARGDLDWRCIVNPSNRAHRLTNPGKTHTITPDTAQMPQQYSNRRPHREGRTAESGPAGLEEGQRRSGGGDAHGPLPVPRRQKEARLGLEFGWHHEAEFALVPKLWDGSVYFSP